MYEIMLMRKAKSWFTGYNSNVAIKAGKLLRCMSLLLALLGHGAMAAMSP
jgi:hypothetical protein